MGFHVSDFCRLQSTLSVLKVNDKRSARCVRSRNRVVASTKLGTLHSNRSALVCWHGADFRTRKGLNTLVCEVFLLLIIVSVSGQLDGMNKLGDKRALKNPSLIWWFQRSCSSLDNESKLAYFDFKYLHRLSSSTLGSLAHNQIIRRRTVLPPPVPAFASFIGSCIDFDGDSCRYRQADVQRLVYIILSC